MISGVADVQQGLAQKQVDQIWGTRAATPGHLWHEIVNLILRGA